MAITLVDINELASTISKDKDMLFVVEVPSGGGYIQRKVTKEVMFQLLGNNLDYTTSPGSQDVITFDGPSGNKVLYINNGSTGVMIFKVGSLGVSADGVTNIIQMGRDGTLRIGTGATNGTLQMRDSGQFYEYSGKDLRQNVVVDLDIQNAATTEAVECRNSIAYLEVDSGGTIASHTIQFPSTAKVGYTFEFYVKGTITALTLEGGAAIVDEALTTVTNGGGKWVRVVTGGGIGVASWRRVSREIQGIPLTGTEVGKLLTGEIEVDASNENVGFKAEDGTLTRRIGMTDDGFAAMSAGDGTGNSALELSQGEADLMSEASGGNTSQILVNPDALKLSNKKDLDTNTGELIIDGYNFRFISQTEGGSEFNGEVYYSADEGLHIRDLNSGYSTSIYTTGMSGLGNGNRWDMGKSDFDTNNSHLLFPDSGSTPRRIPVSVNGNYANEQGDISLTNFDEDIEITDPAKGIILTSPDSSRWRVTVDNTGTLVTTAL